MQTTKIAALLLLLSVVFPARADLGVEHTRLVLDDGTGTVGTRVWNRGAKTSLVQAWMDDGDASSRPEVLKVPYAITPPIFRLEPGKNRDILLRPVDTASLPKDRESVFWLNVLDVPASAGRGGKVLVDYAFRWRMKVFHRPAGLKGNAKDAAVSLEWSFDVDAQGMPYLTAKNSTPYHVSLDRIVIAGSEVTLRTDQSLIAPLSTWSVPVTDISLNGTDNEQVSVSWIDDAGKRHSLKARAGRALAIRAYD